VRSILAVSAGPPRIDRRKRRSEMACRGVHFALTPDEAEKLESAKDDEELMAAVEDIEDRWDRDWLQETDKTWDAIHRCLTDGTLRYGSSPLHKCIPGEGSLFDADDYIVNLLEPSEVKEVAAAVRDIDEPRMRRSYHALDPDEYGQPLSEEDFGYTRDNFQALPQFA
jgi:hypothetical protein